MLTSKLSSKDVNQMVFVTNEHILASMNFYLHDKKENHKIWNIFNIKNGTLVPQKEDQLPWTIILKNDSNFELACIDYSNIDESSERLIVMRNCKDRSDDQFVLQFDDHAKME